VETGAFNLFAWQGVWIAGLWLGARSATGVLPLTRIPRWVAAVCGAVCVLFISVRYGWLGPRLTQEALAVQVDKWHIGPLRVLNLVAFTIVVYRLRKHVAKLVAREPFLTLGKASLQVFCAHLFFVFIGLGLLYGEVEQLHGITAIALISVTFVALFLVALNEVRKRRRQAAEQARERQRQIESGQALAGHAMPSQDRAPAKVVSTTV
jgi:hypothetical protein